MADERIHRAVSADGTEVAGRVYGQGPPLVLVHGRPHDGDIAWQAMLPYLSDRFTCYLPSTRGRGLSADSPDHSPPRLQEDFNSFVESIGDPVFLAGWSTGGPWALGAAAAHNASVATVAVYEPTVIPVMGEDERASLLAMAQQMGVAADDGRLVDAARMFHAWLGTDNELAALDAAYWERCAAVVPATLQSIRQSASYAGSQATDPEVLAKVTVPVLLLRGQQTRRGVFYTDSEQHVAQHVADPHVREPRPGLGHWAPILAPEPVAKELISFFEPAEQPA
ncbi:MAG: alpha/beta fold hydrolase [Candidatus Limnocylindria bacterium]